MELTTAELAERFNVTPRRVLAIAKDRGLLHLSRKVGPARLWQPSARKRLEPGAVGVARGKR